MRSSWKATPFFLTHRIPEATLAVNNRIKIYNKGLVIPQSLVNLRVLIHTGKNFVSLLIRSWHVGKKFGQFVATKKWGASIHISKKSKKKASKKK